MNKVLRDFFTNGAVAWFAAGIIGAIFSKPNNLEQALPYFVAVILTGTFLYLGSYFEEKQK